MKDLIQHNKRVYNKIAAHFSNTRTTIWDDLKPLGKYTKPGDRILDVGCGNGRLYQLFKNLSIEYTGVDLSEELIDIAKKEVLQGRFVVSDMTKLPFKKGEFDIVYCIASFHHLPTVADRIKALKGMKRVLKNDGVLVMTNWNLNSAKAKEKWGNGDRDFMVPWKNDTGKVLGERYYHAFTNDELNELFLKAGFVVVDHYYTSKGKRGADASMSGNIVSILKKPA